MSAVEIGVLIVVALGAVLLVPYLFVEIRKGKVSLGPRLPDGASEPHPGHRGDPAPGHPDAQSNPYDPRATRMR